MHHMVDRDPLRRTAIYRGAFDAHPLMESVQYGLATTGDFLKRSRSPFGSPLNFAFAPLKRQLFGTRCLQGISLQSMNRRAEDSRWKRCKTIGPNSAYISVSKDSRQSRPLL
jgi:hypothetical protein